MTGANEEAERVLILDNAKVRRENFSSSYSQITVLFLDILGYFCDSNSSAIRVVEADWLIEK